VFAIAGVFILVSLLLSQVHHVYWLWFTAFVGANMLQAAFTGFCPLARMLKASGARPGQAFDQARLEAGHVVATGRAAA